MARKVAESEMPADCRVRGIETWRSRREDNGNAPAKPLALPKPALRLTFQEPPEEPKPPPPRPKAPDMSDELEKAERAKEKFWRPYPLPVDGLL